MTSFDLGGGGNAFPFDNIGDTVTGTVLNLEEVQATNMDTGEPEFWPNNQPKMQFRLTLQTELRDDATDDGVRAIYLKGSRKSDSKSSLSAALDAVKRATGATEMKAGATYTHTYVGDGEPSKRGYSPPKFYEGHYVPPAMNLDGQAAPAAPVQQTPVPPPVPAAPVAPAPPAPQQYTAEHIAALKAAGIDPATLQPQT